MHVGTSRRTRRSCNTHTEETRGRETARPRDPWLASRPPRPGHAGRPAAHLAPQTLTDGHRRPQTARQQDTLTASRHSPLRHETGRHLTPT